MHNDKVVIEKVSDAVLVNHLLEDFLFDLGQIDFSSLKGIVHFLRDGEKIGCALNYPPFGAQSEAVHEQCEGGNHLGHAAAVVGGIEIRDAQSFKFGGLVANSLYDFPSNKRLIIFDLSDAIGGHFMNDSFMSADTLADSTRSDLILRRVFKPS